jgi:hypothetical protein
VNLTLFLPNGYKTNTDFVYIPLLMENHRELPPSAEGTPWEEGGLRGMVWLTTLPLLYKIDVSYVISTTKPVKCTNL